MQVLHMKCLMQQSKSAPQSFTITWTSANPSQSSSLLMKATLRVGFDLLLVIAVVWGGVLGVGASPSNQDDSTHGHNSWQHMQAAAQKPAHRALCPALRALSGLYHPVGKEQLALGSSVHSCVTCICCRSTSSIWGSQIGSE